MSDLFDPKERRDTLWNSEDSTLFRFFTVVIIYTDLMLITFFLWAAARLML